MTRAQEIMLAVAIVLLGLYAMPDFAAWIFNQLPMSP